jgi:glutamate-1-semialdehyde 2,1-aminomutase
MTMSADEIEPGRVARLHADELSRFRSRRPRSIELIERGRAHMPNGVPMAWMATDNDQPVYVDHGIGASIVDVDGHSYLDFNTSDVAMFCGHAVPEIVEAVRRQVGRSTQFLLPTEDSIVVAEELADRYPVGFWQFTLSATQANTEAIRLARAVTGRDVVVLFQGHYHGHFEEGLVDLTGSEPRPVARGLSKAVTGRTRIVPFNDVERLSAALATDDVAIVLTEPAMTNQVHFVAPAPEWHTTLRDLTRRHGTLLALDETHTHVVGRGGATGLWHLEPDIVTIGKSIAGGIPLGAYGVTAALAAELHASRNVATGGTLFGNPLSAAAARATLTQVLTPTAYRHATALGNDLADGIQRAIDAHGLSWTAIRFGPRSGQWYGPAPTTSTEALALAVTHSDLTRLIRVWLANRGIWEALPGAGPNVPLPATVDDIRHYLSAYDELLDALTA